MAVRFGARPLVAAFYLPQFHPIPENDAAWGEGFTEWTNVRGARPRFAGHQQPAHPDELGYYDLRDASTRLAQQELAQSHGIDALCWYHYWFDGRRLLHEPLDRMLASEAERLPFMICWANESWTRNWSGQSGEVIVQQRYSVEDDDRHADWLMPVLSDDRYVCVEGRRPLVIYQPTHLPDPASTINRWRARARQAGLGDLLVLGVSSFRQRISNYQQLGLDGIVEQQPDLNLVRPRWRAAPRYLAHRAGLAQRFPEIVRYPYARLVEQATARLARHSADPSYFPTVCTAWDNSPRRERGATILTGSTPALYERWLSTALTSPAPITFVNAWNEWAEGAHLEPDRRHGRGYLDATLRAVHAITASGDE